MIFLIGFEFEFGWQIDDKSYMYQVFSEIRKELKNAFGSDWCRGIKEITTDGSLAFSRKEGNYYGVELISKPLEENEAIIFCKNMLSWMKKNKKVTTNKTCSLHVNISIKDRKINKKIDYYTLLSKVPQKQILQQFERHKNEFCMASEDKTFSLNFFNEETPRHNIYYWIRQLGKKQIKTILKKPHPYLYKTNPNKGRQATISLENPIEYYEMIKKAYLGRLQKSPKGLAIVEKDLVFNKYYEFRMIGNVDYQKRYSEIKKCISIFKKSIKESIV